MTSNQRDYTLALERWLDDGGCDAPAPHHRPRVVIAGAGVAGLETLLALRALAGDRVAVTIVAPEAKFVNRCMAVAQPFDRQRVRGVHVRAVAAEHGARWECGTVDRVEPDRRVVVTREHSELPYDYLVLALGARADTAASHAVLTYRDGRDAAAYRLLLGRLRNGGGRLVFVKPAGPSWPLPLYGLALMTAADCAAHGAPVDISLVTPEEEPLAVFGPRVAAGVRTLLDERQIKLHRSSYGLAVAPRLLGLSPGGRSIGADAIVTLPRLRGPRLRGLPCNADGFVATDSHSRVAGCERIYAAGDATGFPIKQGGIAAQQADAAAASIARAVGADVEPLPFEPVLRAVLLTGGRPRYLQADVSGRRGDDSAISPDPLWWPPTKLCARYLAPYLSRRSGEERDVMPRDLAGQSPETVDQYARA
jgi:sulfide:quinone oxidoreductase